jgi:hypothetical protein
MPQSVVTLFCLKVWVTAMMRDMGTSSPRELWSQYQPLPRGHTSSFFTIDTLGWLDLDTADRRQVRRRWLRTATAVDEPDW